jgi:hypothetical protein
VDLSKKGIQHERRGEFIYFKNIKKFNCWENMDEIVYRILKTKDGETPHWVNDSEGIAIEWTNEDAANNVAELFQNNTTHGYTYVVTKTHFFKSATIV